MIGLVCFFFFFNYDSQIEAPVEKNSPLLASYFLSFSYSIPEGTILYTSAYFNSVPEDMQCFEFYVYILLGIKQNFWEPVPTESISTP